MKAAETNPRTPFLELRRQFLGYHGPEGDLAALDEIRIGWFGPTNTANTSHADMWWAANLAVREVNEQGGLDGRHCRLLPRWSLDPWGTGVSQLAKMLFTQQPVALLGSVDSAATHLAEQVVAKANVPLVSPVTTDGSITLAGVPWMFACAPSDVAIARTLVRAVRDQVQDPTHRLVLISTTDHDSRMTSGEVRRELARLGRAPDFHFRVAPGAPDLSVQLAALREAQPRAVVVVAGAEDAARIVHATRRVLPSVALFGSPATGSHRFRELAGPEAEGMQFPALVCPDPERRAWTQFQARFLAEHDRPPDHAAILTYDATRLLLEAIRQAGPSRARVREALTRLSPWPGLGGVIAFDGTGQNTRAELPLSRF